MERLTTPPVLEAREPRDHYPTPNKAKVQGAVEFCEAMGIDYYKEDVFRVFKVSRQRGYEMLRGVSPRRRHNNPQEKETRGRKSLIPKEKMAEMEYILEHEGLEGRGLTWQQLATEVGLDVSGRTVQRTMESRDYRKCLACRKGWCSPNTASRRLAWARVMLEKYPLWEDWTRVLFSDEVHFGWGPQGPLRIIRKPGQRYCPDCIQYDDPPKPKDEKRFHCWAAIGYDFKSEIHFYDSGNQNGKMTQRAYIDQILEPIIKPWILSGRDFVLEEDGDSGHGPGKNNIVRDWKLQNGLESYFNCASSPDFPPIENCWGPVKAHLTKYPHWDDRTTKGLIYEGWALVSQKYINEQVKSIPQRLKDAISTSGQMTGW